MSAQQKDQFILQLQTQMAAVEAKQAEYSSMQAKLEQSATTRSVPVLDSSQRQKDVEEIRKLQEEKAAMLSEHDKQKSLSKLEGDKERKKSSKMEEEMHLQFGLLQKALLEKEAEVKLLKASSTSTPEQD